MMTVATANDPNDCLLVLAPPSASHNPRVVEDYLTGLGTERRKELHMVDRIALGMVQLTADTYTEAVLLAEEDKESYKQNGIDMAAMVWPKVSKALKTGARVKLQRVQDEAELRKEALISGFIIDKNFATGEMALVKPDQDVAALPLKLGIRKGGRKINLLGLKNSGLIDEDSLVSDDDRRAAIIQPEKCAPAPGKKKKACKDCTCGLKEMEEEQNENARKNRVLLAGDELDFTVQGKVGSCGSCSLGDAFRCDGCPYRGLPAFKPGERVALGGIFAGDDL